MVRQKCWVWFKGGLKESGRWVSGYVATSSEAGGVLIQHPDYVDCRVPEWRISTTEPNDLEQGPDIPDNAVWRLF
ncbi:MAG: hypothetical protein VKJ31_00635 [Synechococcus sp.]|nr:hypothetical protein [Synechococcus sp.]